MPVRLHKKGSVVLMGKGTVSFGGKILGETSKVTLSKADYDSAAAQALAKNIADTMDDQLVQLAAHQQRVMGLDISTATGMVVLEWDMGHGAWRIIEETEIKLPSLPHAATMVQRIERLRELQKQIDAAYTKYNPQVIVIEGYAYSQAQAQVTMVELGAAVRLALMGWVYAPGTSPPKLLEVGTSTLKKFVLGKGIGAKEQVMMQVFKKWGFEAATNNIADAYVLAQMGAAFLSPTVALTKPQQEAMAVVVKKNS